MRRSSTVFLVLLAWAWTVSAQALAQLPPPPPPNLGNLVVSIISPQNGYTVSGTVLVRASVTIVGGLVVAGVQFKLDGYNLGYEDTSPPYEIYWNTAQASNGWHRLTAVARDTFGGQWTSDPVDVTVFNDTTPPSVAIADPGSGATVSGTLTVKASASDDVGVAGVQFFVDGYRLGEEDTAAPYEVPWDTTTAGDGSHALTARARDAAGNTAESSQVTATVANGAAPKVTRFEAETPGNVSFAPAGAWSPVSSTDAGVALSGDVAAVAEAAGATATFTFTGTGVSWLGVRCEVCGIAQVSLDGVPVATVDTYAYTRSASILFTSGTLAAATHVLVVEVTETRNAYSAGTFVVVDAFDVTNSAAPPSPPADATPPAVTITEPAAEATVSGTIRVVATASDDVGVAAVEFLLDGDQPLGLEDPAEPYEVTWDTTSVSDGSHTLTARARDAAGNVGTSAAVTVTVSNAPPPPPAPVRFEETAATLAPAGAWSEASSAEVQVTLSGDRAVFADAAEATATFTFTGTGVSWLGVRCEACGIARVFLDGVLAATVDTFASTRSASVLFTSGTIAAGSHTLVIEVTGTANPASFGSTVVVDAFDVTP